MTACRAGGIATHSSGGHIPGGLRRYSMTSKVLAGVPYVGVHDNALGQPAEVAHPQQSPAKTMYGICFESSSCPFLHEVKQIYM